MQTGPGSTLLIDFVVRGHMQQLLLNMRDLLMRSQIDQPQVIADMEEFPLDLENRLAVLVADDKFFTDGPCSLFDVKFHEKTSLCILRIAKTTIQSGWQEVLS